MKKRIHVNRHHIAHNRKNPDEPPKVPFTVKTYKSNERGFDVVINGPSKLVYSPEKPLSCGAVAWIETDADTYVDGRRIE